MPDRVHLEHRFERLGFRRWRVRCVCGWQAQGRYRWVLNWRKRLHELVAGPLT